MRVVVATGNPHKVEEIESALDFEGWEFVALAEMGNFADPVEDGETFEANARIKARAARAETGCAVIADDSGLVVDALDGRPGVYSSRYAGEHGGDSANNEKLIAELEGVADEDRTARFVSTLVFIDEAGEEIVASGTVEGRIGYEPRGSEGFGYDPLFFPDVYGGQKTLAEVPMAEKNTISHRGNALRKLRAIISATS